MPTHTQIKENSGLRVTGLSMGPVNSPHKVPVTWKMFPFDDVIMYHIEIKSAIKSSMDFSWIFQDHQITL